MSRWRGRRGLEAVSRRGLDNLLVSPVTAALLWAFQVAGALA
jgi:hypothetical protein